MPQGLAMATRALQSPACSLRALSVLEYVKPLGQILNGMIGACPSNLHGVSSVSWVHWSGIYTEISCHLGTDAAATTKPAESELPRPSQTDLLPISVLGKALLSPSKLL